ncbi:MAG: HEPN domain-containing protein [Lachnospiraceae bacterium]|nr:HEPN domain-containing protein [Lachnospiraceae bacterium]MDD7177977.1 HEPN domain-containing protein [bacterium]MDY5516059.1 HEPN domain-containing protein [Lachnospiraceae bacterium]
MCKISEFKIARRDFDDAVVLWNAFKNDERHINNVAYHLQQAVEKTLKAFLQNNGMSDLFTHDITKLVKMSANNGSKAVITDWIDEHSDTLTRWEAETRYNYDFCSSVKTVDTAIFEVQRFLEDNGLKDELREELQDEEKRRALIHFLPKKYRDADDFELNCYYQLFKDKL